MNRKIPKSTAAKLALIEALLGGDEETCDGCGHKSEPSPALITPEEARKLLEFEESDDE